jgi:hypothetical protein
LKGSGKLFKRMAAHTGQSSQLFPVATGRNAKFLSAVARYLTMKKQLVVLLVCELPSRQNLKYFESCSHQEFRPILHLYSSYTPFWGEPPPLTLSKVDRRRH